MEEKEKIEKLKHQRHPLNISIRNDVRKKLEEKALAYAISNGSKKMNISKYVSAIANEELLFFTPKMFKSLKRALRRCAYKS